MMIFHVLLALLFSCMVAFVSFSLLRQVDFSSTNQGKRRMASVLITESPFNRYGSFLVRLLGWEETSLMDRLQRQVRWVMLMEENSKFTAAGLLAFSLALGLLGILLVAAVGDVWVTPLPLVMAYLPFNHISRKTKAWHHKVTEQLGDFTRNVAARMSTGTPLLTAVEQFAEEPGELPKVLRAEIGSLLSQHQNIFTFVDEHGRHQGYLATSIHRWGHPQLNRFAKKLDQISVTGVNQVEVLYTEANSFSRLYQRLIGKATENLRIQVIFPLAIFFFIPLLLSAILPLLLSISL